MIIVVTSTKNVFDHVNVRFTINHPVLFETKICEVPHLNNLDIIEKRKKVVKYN